MTSTGTVAHRAQPLRGVAAPLALVGPTASGKTEASIELATRLDAEIVLIDSMTIYRGMDVGTAKPRPGERRGVPHHLVDIADPAEPFSVAEFQQAAIQTLRDIDSRGRPALLVGGTGLYFRAVVDRLTFPGTEPGLREALSAEAIAVGPARLHARLAELDPEAAAKIEPSNTRRIVRALEVAALTGRPFSSFAEDWERYPRGHVRAAAIRVPTEVLHRRIRERAARQLEEGLLEETRALLERGGLVTASQAIGYAEAAEHLEGKITLDEALEKIVRRTKALARRQMAWFRRDPRIRWFEAPSATDVIDELEEYFRG